MTSLCVNHYLCVSVYHFIQDQSCLPLPLSPKEKRALRMYLSVFRTSLFFVSLYVLLLLLLLLLNLFFIFLFVYYCPIGFFFP